MNHDSIRTVGEVTSLSIIIATLAQWLPPMVSLCALAWYGILFYEWFQKRKNESKTKKD